MVIKPIGGNIIVNRPDVNKTTESGIIIQGKQIEKTVLAKVISVGPGNVNKQGIVEPLTVKEGDLIVILGTAGTELKFAGENIYAIVEADVIAIIKE